MRRVIAHIGAAKTGTTAFQGWLQEHRERLFEAGLLVPTTASVTGNHGGLIKALYQPDRHQRMVEKLYADAADNPAHDILLSAEHFGSVKHPELAIVADKIDRIAGRKIAILVVRDPIAHFNSGFAQHRKAMKGAFPTFEEFLAAAFESARANWRKKIEIFESVGFEMRILPYDAAFKAIGSSRAIMELPDFADLATLFDWSEVPRANPSVGAIGLIIMDLLLAKILESNPEHDGRSPAGLRAKVIEVVNERFDDAPLNGFTPEARRQVIEAYRKDNAWVAERYFTAAWDDVLPPAPERARSPRSIDDLSPATAQAVRTAAEDIILEAEREDWLRPRIRRAARRRAATGAPQPHSATPPFPPA